MDREGVGIEGEGRVIDFNSPIFTIKLYQLNDFNTSNDSFFPVP